MTNEELDCIADQVKEALEETFLVAPGFALLLVKPGEKASYVVTSLTTEALVKQLENAVHCFNNGLQSNVGKLQ